MSHEPAESFCTHGSSCSCFDRLRAEVETSRIKVMDLDRRLDEMHSRAEKAEKEVETLKDAFATSLGKEESLGSLLRKAERSALALAAENGELRGAIGDSHNYFCQRELGDTASRLNEKLRALLSRPPSFWTGKAEAMGKVVEAFEGKCRLCEENGYVNDHSATCPYNDAQRAALAALDSVGEAE